MALARRQRRRQRSECTQLACPFPARPGVCQYISWQVKIGGREAGLHGISGSAHVPCRGGELEVGVELPLQLSRGDQRAIGNFMMQCELGAGEPLWPPGCYSCGVELEWLCVL